MSTSSLLDHSEYINNLLDDLKIENSLRFEPGELKTTTDTFFAVCEHLIQSITKYHNLGSMLIEDSVSYNSIDQVCYSYLYCICILIINNILILNDNIYLSIQNKQ